MGNNCQTAELKHIIPKELPLDQLLQIKATRRGGGCSLGTLAWYIFGIQYSAAAGRHGVGTPGCSGLLLSKASMAEWPRGSCFPVQVFFQFRRLSGIGC